jgi:hypothetical protein
MAAVGAPVVQYVLNTSKIASGCADTNALFRQPKLVHVGFRSQSTVQVSPGNLIKTFLRPAEAPIVNPLYKDY